MRICTALANEAWFRYSTRHMAYLFLVRHGHSEWNALGQWTGQTDVGLAPEGYEEARKAAQALAGVQLHAVHVSPLTRTRETARTLLEEIGHGHLVPEEHPAILERHYGAYTGKNKWQVRDEIGEEAFLRLRRGWDEPVPEGETLKDVHARVVPHYESYIKPHLDQDKNVLVVSHGNTLRALIKHLEDLSEEAIAECELSTGEVIRYTYGPNGIVLDVASSE